jgi:hypothetical protein
VKALKSGAGFGVLRGTYRIRDLPVHATLDIYFARPPAQRPRLAVA